MNPDTRVVVSCYQGDAQQVADLMPLYRHHECPVSIFSPIDAPVTIQFEGNVTKDIAGLCGQNGEAAQRRHLKYLDMLLAFPEQFFLMHESDSFCLDPQIPQYLYDEPDTFWANAIPDGGTRPGIPTLSFQAPWFLSRKTVTALTEAARHVTFDPELLWIDLYLVQLTQAAGIKWSPFKDAACVPIAASVYNHDLTQWHRDTYARGFEIGKQRAREGANMIHSCKSIDAGLALKLEYERRPR